VLFQPMEHESARSFCNTTAKCNRQFSSEKAAGCCANESEFGDICLGLEPAGPWATLPWLWLRAGARERKWKRV
jgi:hypothetical protein